MGHRSAVAAVLVAALLPSLAAAGERIVLVPLENLTRAAGARETLMPALAAGLVGKGYQVVIGETVERYLREKRIRYLDSLPAAQVDELLAELEADAVMVGTILSYDRRRADPLVALALTVVAKGGEVRWSDVDGLAASESRGAFDLDKTRDLAVLGGRLVRRMMEHVPRERMRRVDVWDPGRGPRVFRDRGLRGRELTICVLPLENLSGARDAVRVVETAIHHRISERRGVTALLPAELRRKVVEAGLRAPSRLTLDQLRRLSRTTGTPYFLLGTILDYDAAGEQARGAAVEIYLRLLDAESGRTVWSGLHRRTGGEYQSILGFGIVRDPASLATYTIAELLDAFTRR